MKRLSDLIKADRALSALTPSAAGQAAKSPLKHLYDGPAFDGKRCAECQRAFKTTAEYVICRLCKQPVCRRRDQCKHVHQGKHRVELLRARAASTSSTSSDVTKTESPQQEPQL